MRRFGRSRTERPHTAANLEGMLGLPFAVARDMIAALARTPR